MSSPFITTIGYPTDQTKGDHRTITHSNGRKRTTSDYHRRLPNGAACTSCREKKCRCDGSSPCMTCVSHGRACSNRDIAQFSSFRPESTIPSFHPRCHHRSSAFRYNEGLWKLPTESTHSKTKQQMSNTEVPTKPSPTHTVPSKRCRATVEYVLN